MAVSEGEAALVMNAAMLYEPQQAGAASKVGRQSPLQSEMWPYIWSIEPFRVQTDHTTTRASTWAWWEWHNNVTCAVPHIGMS